MRTAFDRATFFLEKIQENFEEKSSFYGVYERNLSFNSEVNELSLSIKKRDETIARAIFFITPEMQKKLEKIHTKESAQ